MTQQQRVQPIDKGRAVTVIEKYPSGEVNPDGSAKMKNRYGTVGRATMWPAKQGATHPNVEIEIDTIPIGFVAGSMKVSIFWDSEQNQQQAQQPAPQQQQTGGYQQPNQYQQTRG